MDQYILVHFKTSPEQAAIIEAFLMDMGFEGIEETETGSVACILETAYDEAATRAIFNQFDVQYEVSKIEQQNWNAQWEQSFEPVIVDEFVAIRASFHEPVAGVAHEIIITPKMSFGTGHHSTTYLVMQQMEALDFEGKSVIDFGTGTGVLAILAEKLGAKHILAIDNDDWSINNALENIQSNDCKNIRLLKADSMSKDQIADVILANINLNVIIANIGLIKKACAPGAVVILSGLMTQDETQMREILTINGFELIHTVNKTNWIAIKTKLI